MKKLTTGLAAMLYGVAASSFATCAVRTSSFNVCVPSFNGGCNFGVTGYYGRASRPYLDYVLNYPSFVPSENDPFNLIVSPLGEGRFLSVNHKFHWGYRINAGYIFPCTGNDLNLAYTHWDFEDSDHVDRGAGVLVPTFFSTDNGVILFPSELGFPTTPVSLMLYAIFYYFNPDSQGGVPVDRINTVSDITYQAWDLEFGQYVNMGSNLHMRWFAGVRWTQLISRLDINYSGSLINIDVTAALPATDLSLLTLEADIKQHLKSDYQGVGPRLGLNSTYEFGKSGFGIVGETSAGLLIGEIDSHFKELEHYQANILEITPLPGSPTNESIVNSNHNFRIPDATRIVPNLEAKFGFNYAYRFHNYYGSKFIVEAGYFITHYYNSNDISYVAELARLLRFTERPIFIETPVPEYRTQRCTDNSFEGVYMSLQVQI